MAVNNTTQNHIIKNDAIQKSAKSSLRYKVQNIIKNITVEPVIILYLLPTVTIIIATNNLNLQKACRVNLQLDEEICRGMETRDSTKFNQSHEIAVQKLVSNMNIWKTCLSSIFPGILLAFFGSWSDRTGRRKPCMILPIIGELVCVIGLLFCTYFYYEMRMEYTGLIEAIPVSLSGSLVLMSIGIYSYISSITTPETRTFRLGIVYICTNLSITAGFPVSGILYTFTGFYGVFGSCLVLYSSCLIYCNFFIKEKLNSDCISGEKQDNTLKSIFNFRSLVETYTFISKKREFRWRIKIIAIIVLGVVLSGPMLGTILALGLFSKVLHLHDVFLGMIACISKIFGGITYAFAPTSEIFYLGTVAEMLSGTAQIALKSIMSKIVPSDELGKINSLVGLFESLTLLFYGPLYNFTYKLTIDILPGAFYLVGAALIFPGVFLFLWMYYEEKNARSVIYSVNR